MGEIVPGVLPQGVKTCFVCFFLLSRQRDLLATYPTPISTIQRFFESTDMNRFLHVYAGKNFPISVQGFFQVAKTAQNTVL